MAIPPIPPRPFSSSVVPDTVWIGRTSRQRRTSIGGCADRPTRTIRSGRRTGVVWGIGLCLLAGIVESPVRADGFAPVPVGTAIRGSDLLVPLRLAKPAGDLPDRVVVQIDETEIEAEESPLPSAVQTMLGSRRFALASRAKWYLDHHDEAHCSTFESSPRIMSSRLQLRGKSWLLYGHLDTASQDEACEAAGVMAAELADGRTRRAYGGKWA